MYATTLIKSFKNNFWNDTLLAYREFQSKVKSENINDILALPLWYNDMILIDNKSIFFKNLKKESGLLMICLTNMEISTIIMNFAITMKSTCL